MLLDISRETLNRLMPRIRREWGAVKPGLGSAGGDLQRKGVARGRDWRFDGAKGWRGDGAKARRDRAGGPRPEERI